MKAPSAPTTELAHGGRVLTELDNRGAQAVPRSESIPIDRVGNIGSRDRSGSETLALPLTC